jgi:hypothetical protein
MQLRELRIRPVADQYLVIAEYAHYDNPLVGYASQVVITSCWVNTMPQAITLAKQLSRTSVEATACKPA